MAAIFFFGGGGGRGLMPVWRPIPCRRAQIREERGGEKGGEKLRRRRSGLSAPLSSIPLFCPQHAALLQVQFLCAAAAKLESLSSLSLSPLCSVAVLQSRQFRRKRSRMANYHLGARRAPIYCVLASPLSVSRKAFLLVFALLANLHSQHAG